LLIIAFRKILKNKWLVVCQLLGLMISVATVSSIPIYTQAVMQKSLIKELEGYQEINNKFTGSYLISMVNDDTSLRSTIQELIQKEEKVYEDTRIVEFYRKRLSAFKQADRYIRTDVPAEVGIPVLASASSYSIDKREIRIDNSSKGLESKKGYANLESLSSLQEHIAVVDGRVPGESAVNGVYEVMVSEAALKKLDLLLGRTYELKDPKEDGGYDPIRVKVAGVFTIRDSRDLYWSFRAPDSLYESLFMDENLMRKDFIEKEPTLLYKAMWYLALDYQSMTAGGISRMGEGHATITKNLYSMIYKPRLSMEAPFMDKVYSYSQKSKQLSIMLWALYVPLMIMLFLYLYMISGLIVDRERNEISVLASRGASKFQIVQVYLLGGLVLGAAALATGPGLGLVLSRLLGASDGFLQFAGRKALPAGLTSSAYTYALFAIGISLVAVLIPAIAASRVSIVDHKRSLSGKPGLALWEKLFIDILLLGVSIYGYFTYLDRQKMVRITGASADDLQVDPLLFLTPALFILGIGLLLLRLYPFIVHGIYWLGRRFWSVSMYVTLNRVGKTIKSYHFLMVFLIMTLSVGIFSATAARTINLNAREKVYYKIGCDIAAEPLWDEYNSSGVSSLTGIGTGESSDLESGTSARTKYFEPSFLPYTQLDGIQHAAKVFIKNDVMLNVKDKGAEGVRLMAVDTYDFGEVVWFRSGLLKHHINEYLNVMALEPGACLISATMSKAYGIKTGDSIQIRWPNSGTADVTVYGIIEYWPSWNPNKEHRKEEKADPLLVVANLSYIQEHLGVEPYRVWLKLKDGAASKQVYKSMEDKKLRITNLSDAHQEMIAVKNNPFYLAINGAFTLCFLISGLICFFGFLLYWILSIKARTLQFGIFRAMGLSVRHLVSMIIWEQVLTSGIAVLIGIIVGLISSKLFVPFFQMAFDAYSQVPPFKVVSYAADRTNIYILVGVTMLLCLGVLGILLSGIRINQALKLGED
jgi:putative ABC transport system permease protein